VFLGHDALIVPENGENPRKTA